MAEEPGTAGSGGSSEPPSAGEARTKEQDLAAAQSGSQAVSLQTVLSILLSFPPCPCTHITRTETVQNTALFIECFSCF